MATLGFAGNWWVADQLQYWPSWSLFPGVALSVTCLVAMVIGLGLLVIRALEPVLATMELDWDAEPLAALAIPPALQRKCEALGYWAADELARAVEKGTFPWTSLAYDERMQLERAAHRWSAAIAAEKKAKKARGGRRAAGQQSGD
jgi:hypothetical protein